MFNVNVEWKPGYVVYEIETPKGFVVDELVQFIGQVAGSGMQQSRAVRMLLNEIERYDLRSINVEREIKSLSVVVYGGFITVRSCTGLVGDENSLAEVFARDERYVKIGKRGSMKAQSSLGGKWRSDGFVRIQRRSS